MSAALLDAGLVEIDEEERDHGSGGIATDVVLGHRGWVAQARAAAPAAAIAELEPRTVSRDALLHRALRAHGRLACDCVTCWSLGCDRLDDQLEDLLEAGDFTVVAQDEGVCDGDAAFDGDDPAVDGVAVRAALRRYGGT